MKPTRILLLAASLGSLLISILPGFVAANRPFLNKKGRKEAYRRLDIYGSRN